jgi:uncharacterized protein (DUF1499 family)
MVRRNLILADPDSRLARISRALALFAFAVLVLGIFIVRGGYLEFYVGLSIVFAAFALALLAVVTALIAYAIIWVSGANGARHATLALVIGLVMLAYPALLAVQATRLPMLADVTTDGADPPRFEAISRVRRADANTVAYPGADIFAKQQAAYPRLTPLVVDRTADDVFEAVSRVMARRGWLVLESRAPQTGRREGRIEAVARTTLLGFRDDVVVRVRSQGDGSRVDIRSASRYGQHDFGANAARVNALLDDIAATIPGIAPK